MRCQQIHQILTTPLSGIVLLTDLVLCNVPIEPEKLNPGVPDTSMVFLALGIIPNIIINNTIPTTILKMVLLDIYIIKENLYLNNDIGN